MADVFLSYDRDDHAAAERLAQTLREMGFSVDLERHVAAGRSFEDVISESLASASAVVVLWSARSIKSEWVQRELAAAPGHVVSVYIERVERQIMGGMHLAVDLSAWTGSPDAPEFQRLVTGIRSRLEDVGFPAHRPPSGASGPGRRPRLDDTGLSLGPALRTKVAVNSSPSVGAAWETVRAYLYPAFDETKVREDAHRLRPTESAQHTSAAANLSTIRVGTLVTVIIHLPGAECRRKQQRFIWRGRWKEADFDVRYLGEPVSAPQSGNISWFAGIVCIGQRSFDVQLTSQPQEPSGPPSLSTASGYESVFVSYSTKDSAIVDWLETTYTALGMTYLRDVKTLRSGETWDKRLLELIDGADLFQLCWSANARQSAYVADEWRFALGVQKPNFIRPCYWDDPMPEPPPELGRLHFTKLKLNWFTRMWFRLRARFG
jgi:hypothetical protein